MDFEKEVIQVGNSLYIPFPKDLAERLKWTEGTRIVIHLEAGGEQLNVRSLDSEDVRALIARQKKELNAVLERIKDSEEKIANVKE